MTHLVFTMSGIITNSKNFEKFGFLDERNLFNTRGRRKSGRYFARTKDDALNSLNCHVCHIFDVTCYSMDCRASGV